MSISRRATSAELSICVSFILVKVASNNYYYIDRNILDLYAEIYILLTT